MLTPEKLHVLKDPGSWRHAVLMTIEVRSTSIQALIRVGTGSVGDVVVFSDGYGYGIARIQGIAELPKYFVTTTHAWHVVNSVIRSTRDEREIDDLRSWFKNGDLNEFETVARAAWEVAGINEMTDADREERLQMYRDQYSMTDADVVEAAKNGTMPSEPDFASWLVLMNRGDLLIALYGE
jgi:hypothetical protein